MVLKNQKLIQLDQINSNGRIYSTELLKDALAKIDGPLLGQLEHPDSTEVMTKNATHVIYNLRIEGKTVVGDIKIIGNTKAVKLLKATLSTKVFRPRGTGCLDKHSNVYNYTLLGFDAVDSSTDPWLSEKTNLL
jgi:hypothetical protein